MNIKILTEIFMEVRDEEQGEIACITIEDGLESQLAGFPEGEIIGVKVQKFEKVEEAELGEHGFVE